MRPAQALSRLRWPVGVRARIGVEAAVAGALSIVALGFGLGSVEIASGPSSPILSYAAMDEAVYGHAAARMVRTGHLATPIFLDRLLLNKPPLLMWAGAASMRLFGISPLALRAPAVLAGAGCCVLVYIWLRRLRSAVSACAGVILLWGSPLFHTVARRFTTDILLALFIVAPLFALSIDARLERRWSAVWFGVLSGAAIITKSAAGLLPLLILLGYCLLAGKTRRPGAGRVLLAFAVAAAAAAPWHLYQLIAHREWFLTEYLGVQLFTVGLSWPAVPGETKLGYYLSAMLKTDPLMLLLALTALPWLVAAWRRGDRARAGLLGVWIVVGCAGVAGFSHRAAYYLLPLLPAFVLAACQFSPLLGRRAATATCCVLLGAFAARVWAGDQPWGLTYCHAPSPDRASLESYSRLRRSNELVLVEPQDDCYAAVLDLPKIRYAFAIPRIDYHDTPEFFYWLGIIMRSGDFCALPDTLPMYARRLDAWHAPSESVATVIMARSRSELVEVIRHSPSRDFSLPEELRNLATPAAAATHRATAGGAGRFFLLAIDSARRIATNVAPGTVVVGSEAVPGEDHPRFP